MYLTPETRQSRAVQRMALHPLLWIKKSIEPGVESEKRVGDDTRIYGQVVYWALMTVGF